jgi:TetR/AcrR family transcriptional repressor of nem operon
MVSKVRQKIVDAALDRFHALGFNACGVQEIVDKAGVPKGSFYNYFKAKELLAIEVLQVYAKGSGREALTDKRHPVIKRLRIHFETMAKRYASFGYSKGCLIGNMAAETSDAMPLIRKALGESLDQWTSQIAAAIREGQADGSIAIGLDPESFARFLINSWEGAIVRMKIAASRQPLDDFFAIAFPLLVAQQAQVASRKEPARKSAAKQVAERTAGRTLSKPRKSSARN